MKRSAIPKRRTRPRKGPWRSKEYREWIAKIQCVVCWPSWRENLDYLQILRYDLSEAAHTGPHGISQKAADDTCIPLCAEHHRVGKDALDRLGKRFWAHHGIDRDALLAELQKRFELR